MVDSCPMDDERYLPPDRPARRPGQEPTARLTLHAYVRMRKELEQLETDGRRLTALRRTVRRVSGRLARPTFLVTIFGLLQVTHHARGSKARDRRFSFEHGVVHNHAP